MNPHKEAVRAAVALAEAAHKPLMFETVKTSSGLCHKIGPLPWRLNRVNHACIYDDYPGIDGGTPVLIATGKLFAAAHDHVTLIQQLSDALDAEIAARAADNAVKDAEIAKLGETIRQMQARIDGLVNFRSTVARKVKFIDDGSIRQSIFDAIEFSYKPYAAFNNKSLK